MLFPGGCCFLVGGLFQTPDQDACAGESLFSSRCWLMVDAVSWWVLFPGFLFFKTPDHDVRAGESLFSNICWLMVDAVSWWVLFPGGMIFLNA